MTAHPSMWDRESREPHPDEAHDRELERRDREREKAPYTDPDRMPDDWAANSGHGAMWGYRERP